MLRILTPMVLICNHWPQNDYIARAPIPDLASWAAVDGCMREMGTEMSASIDSRATLPDFSSKVMTASPIFTLSPTRSSSFNKSVPFGLCVQIRGAVGFRHLVESFLVANGV